MAKRRSNISVLFKFVLGGILSILIIFLYIVFRGAINYDRLNTCNSKPLNEFCGIQEINLGLPNSIKSQILSCVEQGFGKRVVIQGWKAGRTISTGDVFRELPGVWNYYKSLEEKVGEIIGEKVYITSEKLPTTCAILVYEEDGDFINWHYDVNYFNGRFFTLLIPVTIENSCTLYTYYDKNNEIQTLESKENKSILFEGDKTFHMASKFCNHGQKRIVLSVQFSTDPTISWYNNILMRIKDTAYIGF